MYAIVILVMQTADVEAGAHSYCAPVTMVTMVTDIGVQVTCFTMQF